jgi:hypothetical protein
MWDAPREKGIARGYKLMIHWLFAVSLGLDRPQCVPQNEVKALLRGNRLCFREYLNMSFLFSSALQNGLQKENRQTDLYELNKQSNSLGVILEQESFHERANDIETPEYLRGRRRHPCIFLSQRVEVEGNCVD